MKRLNSFLFEFMDLGQSTMRVVSLCFLQDMERSKLQEYLSKANLSLNEALLNDQYYVKQPLISFMLRSISYMNLFVD